MTREERVIGIGVCLMQPFLLPYERHVLREVRIAIENGEEAAWIAANQHLSVFFEALVAKLRTIPNLASQIEEAIHGSPQSRNDRDTGLQSEHPQT
jgi:hypothetical protein